MTKCAKYHPDGICDCKVPFYYSNEHDQGMGVPSQCRCGGDLGMKRLGWTCERCGTGYGK